MLKYFFKDFSHLSGTTVRPTTSLARVRFFLHRLRRHSCHPFFTRALIFTVVVVVVCRAVAAQARKQETVWTKPAPVFGPALERNGMPLFLFFCATFVSRLAWTSSTFCTCSASGPVQRGRQERDLGWGVGGCSKWPQERSSRG